MGLAGGCAGEPGPWIPATATIENLLPADGCSFPVVIDGVAHAPNAAALDFIRARFASYGRYTRDIEYRRTGRTGDVECGRAAHQELPEIAISFIER